MLPTCKIGSLQIKTYSAVYAVALLVAGMYAFFRLRKLKTPPNILTRNLLLTLLGGFAGTYLVGIVPTLLYWVRSGTLTWANEASFVGTLGGGIGVAALCIRQRGTSLGRAFDLGGLPWPLFLAIGRVGCQAAGCCYGRPTDSWMGLYLPDVYGVWQVRYPTQLISGVANLFTFGLLLAVERYGKRRVEDERGWPFDGFLFLLYLALFCVERFSIEFLRQDSVPLIGPFSWVHFATLAGLIVTVGLIAWNLRKEALDENYGDRTRSRIHSIS